MKNTGLNKPFGYVFVVVENFYPKYIPFQNNVMKQRNQLIKIKHEVLAIHIDCNKETVRIAEPGGHFSI